MTRFPILFGLAIATACGSDSGPPAGPDAAPPAKRLSQVIAISPLRQIGLTGSMANHPPAVRSVDEHGVPVSGVVVRFVAHDGQDSVLITTNVDGVARWPGWIAPSSPTVSSVAVRADTFPTINFELESRTRGFDIVFRVIEGSGGPEGDAALAAAEARLESLVFADLPNAMFSGPVCMIAGGPAATTLDEEIDDLLVLVRFRDIDGLGGAGASGNPCLIRNGPGPTLVGIIDLDLAEWQILTAQLRRDFILHETVHVMGLVPNLINLRGCLAQPSSGPPNTRVDDSHFTCPYARSAFELSGGGGYEGAKVPLENGATRTLTSHTLNHHWRKSVFGAELMTGWFSSGGAAPFSRVTLGALEDLGFGVVAANADAWSVGNPGPMTAVYDGSNESK